MKNNFHRGIPNSSKTRFVILWMLTALLFFNESVSKPNNVYNDGLRVTDFVLINSINDTELLTLSNGMVLYTNNIPKSVNIKANVSTQPGSVRFSWQNNATYRIENLAPYALAGDNNGNYFNLTLTAGTYSLKATPFTKVNAEGTAGQSLWVTFTVVSGSGPVNHPPVASVEVESLYCRNSQISISINASDPDGDNISFSLDPAGDPLPKGLSLNNSSGVISGLLQRDFNEGSSTFYVVIVEVTDAKGASATVVVSIFSIDCGIPEVVDFILVNSITDTDMFAISDGTILYIKDLPASINIRANVDPQPGSVLFSWQNNTSYRTENFAPYALAGDNNGNYHNLTIEAGIYTIKATPYMNANAGGTKGLSKDITFTIVNGSGFSSYTRNKVAGFAKESSDDFDTEPVLIYPNPVQSEFTIEVEVKEPSSWNFILFNSLGDRTSLGSYFLTKGISKIDFDVNVYPLYSGMYFLHASNSIFETKIIKLVFNK